MSDVGGSISCEMLAEGHHTRSIKSLLSSWLLIRPQSCLQPTSTAYSQFETKLKSPQEPSADSCLFISVQTPSKTPTKCHTLSVTGLGPVTCSSVASSRMVLSDFRPTSALTTLVTLSTSRPTPLNRRAWSVVILQFDLVLIPEDVFLTASQILPRQDGHCVQRHPKSRWCHHSQGRW